MTNLASQSVPAALLLDQIAGLGVTHVVTVPDTHQRTLLELLAEDSRLRLLTVSTEDEAICVNAGLWMGGAEPMLLIQNVGLFAGLNALRAISQDTKTPACILVGQFGREVEKPVEDNRASAVRLIGPLMETMGVPFYTIDEPGDAPLIARAFEESRERQGPVVVLIGAPTI